MSLYRYEAIPIAGGARQRGEWIGESAASVRAALRGIGLQVLTMEPVRGKSSLPAQSLWTAHRRARHTEAKAEFFDALSTLLTSGMAMSDALTSLGGGLGSSALDLRTGRLAQALRESIRAGGSLSKAMAEHPEWFRDDERAIVEAAEHSGTLPATLLTLASRAERSFEVQGKLIGALSYPAIVATAGLCAALFLSQKTLPELCSLLDQAKVRRPALTQAVIDFGGAVVSYGWIVPIAALALGGAVHLASRRSSHVRNTLDALTPRALRSLASAQALHALWDLLHHGIPLVDAVRIATPALRTVRMRAVFERAASDLERGETLSASLRSSGNALDAPTLRMIEVAEASGELPRALEVLSMRLERSARRTIDRATALLEPGAILILAALIGVVVSAAAAAMVALQEVIR